jgi:hypothetical protein
MQREHLAPLHSLPADGHMLRITVGIGSIFVDFCLVSPGPEKAPRVVLVWFVALLLGQACPLPQAKLRRGVVISRKGRMREMLHSQQYQRGSSVAGATNGTLRTVRLRSAIAIGVKSAYSDANFITATRVAQPTPTFETRRWRSTRQVRSRWPSAPGRPCCEPGR